MDSTEKNAQAQAPKKEKRDWLQLLIVPVVLTLVGGFITYANNKVQLDIAEQNNKQQQQLADDKQKDEVLKNYFEEMRGLLLDKDYPLGKSKPGDDSRSVARTLTLTALRQLASKRQLAIERQGQEPLAIEQDWGNADPNYRKGAILQFLQESKLIKGKSPIVNLNQADFREIAFLFSPNLRGVNLTGAFLSDAYLFDTDLRDAFLSGVDLGGAFLSNASIEGANLNGASLFKAIDLTKKQIKSTCSWEKAIYTLAEWDTITTRWKVRNENDNQHEIKALQADKASNPIKPVDCSQWHNP